MHYHDLRLHTLQTELAICDLLTLYSVHLSTSDLPVISYHHNVIYHIVSTTITNKFLGTSSCAIIVFLNRHHAQAE